MRARARVCVCPIYSWESEVSRDYPDDFPGHHINWVTDTLVRSLLCPTWSSNPDIRLRRHAMTPAPSGPPIRTMGTGGTEGVRRAVPTEAA